VPLLLEVLEELRPDLVGCHFGFRSMQAPQAPMHGWKM
jgi:hypothetical protein